MHEAVGVNTLRPSLPVNDVFVTYFFLCGFGAQPNAQKVYVFRLFRDTYGIFVKHINFIFRLIEL